MACPVCLGGGAFLLITGLYSVFFQDRRLYRIWWTVLFGLIAGWTAYFTVFDRAVLARYTLETLSVIYFLILEIRLLQLVVRDGLRPPGTQFLSRLTQACTPYTLHPITVMIKTFIITLIGLEYFGKATFSWEWYAVSCSVLVAWLLVLAFGVPFLRRLVSRSMLLQRLFISPEQRQEGGCPLGYGQDSPSSRDDSSSNTETS